MAGKDQRSRQARRGGHRRTGSDAKEAAAAAAAAAAAQVEAETREVEGQTPHLPGQLHSPAASQQATAPATSASSTAPPTLPTAALLPPAAGLPTINEEKRMTAAFKKSSPAHALLAQVPTPNRSPKSAEISSDATPQGSGAESRFGMGLPPRGPEPWGLQDPTAPLPPTAPKGGYREWLQARGQQAMQRSLLHGASPAGRAAQAAPAVPPAPPPAVPAPCLAPAPCPAPLAGVLSGLTGPAPTATASPASAQVQLPAWFGHAGVDMSPLAGGHSPAALAFGACSQQALVLPGCGQQTAVAFVQGAATPLSGQQSPLTFGALSQPPHMAFGACHQGAAAPLGGQAAAALPFGLCPQSCPQAAPAPAPAGQQAPRECSQQDLMAALMPQGFSGLGSEQLAAQLRAAAPCSYDD